MDYVVIKLLYPQVISKSVRKGNLTDFYLSMEIMKLMPKLFHHC